MDTILKELQQNTNVRGNLSKIRQIIKEEEKCQRLKKDTEDGKFFIQYLDSLDAKTRKNAALLLGELACQEAVEQLLLGYQKEETLFVKASYLNALSHLDVQEHLSELKEQLANLISDEPLPENKKHVDEQVRELRKIVIRYEGITHHTFSPNGKHCEALLLCNREQREAVSRSILEGRAKVHPLGVLVETDELQLLMNNRLYRDMLFPVHTKGLLPAEPVQIAKELWESDLYQILTQLHKEGGEFYFRIECKSQMTLEERSMFSKKLSAELERVSGGKLVNSTTDYEVEIRLIANRDGAFFPGVKLYTMNNKRFAYRKNYIAASINPSTAALIMELAEPYLEEDAQIMDPFCGVGTMLIERNIKVPAREIYATDTFGEAIEKGRENARLAGVRINFIHRDFFDFKHEYLFDEIITNMPVRGRKTKDEMDQFYADFFQKVPELLTDEAVIIMYTNEIGFVKKQLRIHKEFRLMQEYCMQKKNDFYLLIIGAKR